MDNTLRVEALEAQLRQTRDPAQRLELFEMLAAIEPTNVVYGSMVEVLRKKPVQDDVVLQTSVKESAIAFEEFRDEQTFQQEEGQQWRKERGEWGYGKHK